MIMQVCRIREEIEVAIGKRGKRNGRVGDTWQVTGRVYGGWRILRLGCSESEVSI